MAALLPLELRQGLEDRAQLAGEDLLQRVALPEAVVGDAVLGPVVGAHALAAVARAHLALAGRGALGVEAALLGLEQPRGEDAHRLRAVLVLGLLVLADDDGVRRQVRDAHGGARLVDVLAARAGGAHRVDAQVVVLDLDVRFLGLGEHRDRGGGGVDAALRLGGGHALHAMPAGLEAQEAPAALARHGDDELLEAADLAGRDLELLELPALRLGEALVHAVEVAREERGLVPAGAGADLEDHARAAVLGARDELALDRGGELLELALDLRQVLAREVLQLLLLRWIGEHRAGLLRAREQLGVALVEAARVLELAVLAQELRVARARRLAGRGEALGELAAAVGALPQLGEEGGFQHHGRAAGPRLVQPRERVRGAAGARAPRAESRRARGSALLVHRREVDLAVLPGEAVDAAGGVDVLLLAGVEGVARAADLDPDLARRRAGLERRPAAAGHLAVHVLGMDVALHG
jgi:hypothetical protein